jgi:hypothetical protein
LYSDIKFIGLIKSIVIVIVIEKGRKSSQGSSGGKRVKLQNLMLLPNNLSIVPLD